MDVTTEPVWIWLPGQADPVQAGTFEWTGPSGPGRFSYSSEYKERKDAIHLDPLNMSMGVPKLLTSKQGGIFGVMRDAGPDYWGESLIKKQYALSDLTPLQRITLAGANASGCIATGKLSAERMPRRRTLEQFEKAGEDWARGDADDQDPNFQKFLQVVAPTPSLGGAKPKVELEFDDAQWILKFPERGDPDDLACAEATALSLAEECGIEVPKRHRVVTIGAGHKQVKGILMQRFDRCRIDGGFERLGFASAFSVMNLDSGTENSQLSSYQRFAQQAMLWSARAQTKEHGIEQKRHIWKRIVLTALISNSDDHARNHALICERGSWRLSPVFDIIPVAVHGQRATILPYMPNKPDGNALSLQRLLEAAPHYSWNNAEEAKSEVHRMAEIVTSSWEQFMNSHGASRALIDARASAFDLSREIAQSLQGKRQTASSARPSMG